MTTYMLRNTFYLKYYSKEKRGKFSMLSNAIINSFFYVTVQPKKNEIDSKISYSVRNGKKFLAPLPFLHSSTLYIPMNRIIPKENLGTPF